MGIFFSDRILVGVTLPIPFRFHPFSISRDVCEKKHSSTYVKVCQSHPPFNQSIKRLLGNFINAHNISILQSHQHLFRSSSFWFSFARTISTYFQNTYHCTYRKIFRIKCHIHWNLNVICPICMWAKGRKTFKEHSAWMNSLHNRTEMVTNPRLFSWTESIQLFSWTETDSLKFLPLRNCPVC